MRLDAFQVANLLEEIGRRLELAGEPRFKHKAYQKAADTLRALPEPLLDVVEQGRLRELPGIGEALAEKIETLHRTGTHRTLERLRQEYPAGLLELLPLKIRREKILALYHDLGIASVEQLKAAAEAGELAGAKGFGASFQAKVLQAIRLREEHAGLMHLHRAHERSAAAAERLRALHPELDSITVAGPARRGCEVVDRLVLAARGAPLKPIALPDTAVFTSASESFGLALLHATGAEEHLELLREHAAGLGLALKPDSLLKDGTPVPCPTEEALYSALELPFIIPELREGRDEIARAKAGRLPNPVRLEDLRGILHSHTDFSDGIHTLEEMAEGARERGHRYYGVADHSQSAFYAGGLKPERVRAQRQLVDALNARYAADSIPFRVFHGIESDILPDGSLDYSDDVLREFDFVVASVHGRFSLDGEEQTRRIVKAVSNPHTTILGHPTGRLLLSRNPYNVDLERVLEACAEHGVAVEINCNPHRLDLDWRWHERALELGCLFSINTDAHSLGELDLVRWGVLIARKGGVPAERVLTCKDLDALSAHFELRRSRLR